MKTKLIWDDTKRRANLAKHGLDFTDADEVIDSDYRMDSLVLRNGELRTQSISYAFGFLAVLTAVHVGDQNATRIISFRRASTREREVYYEWLEHQFNES